MDWTGVILILLLFFPAIMFLLKRGRSWNNSSPNLPPGPKTIPLLGNLHMMDLKRPYKTMMEWSKEYGSIFRIKLGLQEMVVLTGYETVKEALVNQADVFSDRPSVPIFEDATKGFGLAFARGENWKVMRRFTLSTLRDYGMGKRTIEDKITEECSVLTKTMETYAGKPFDITRIVTAAVSNIIVSILLGKRYEYEDTTFLRLLKIIRENIQLGGSPAVLENMKMAHGGYFHNGNLIGIVEDLFGAGTDSTGSTLRWAILLMMKYPEIQSKIQAEIAREIGDIQPRTDHRVKMPYTDAVIHECQRFADIVPSNLPHGTTMDITFKGFFIPKGTYIIPLLTSVLHDESQWEKPHEFYPEHFLDSEGKFVKRDAFMPFSAGRRVCAGSMPPEIPPK
ncbi:Cytochrome protein [Ophiophagus hannah]|uniref:Cytochrome protein n=1 Tax=Ophiophagus hannah TaxID=8665 RepID=V8N8S7_OPHHA|nr:Cytochrome protein [Ophiophagus hannah]